MNNLKTPRTVMMLVSAGKAVADVIEELLEVMDKGNIIIVPLFKHVVDLFVIQMKAVFQYLKGSNASRNEAWGEIGYGIMWPFVVALIEGTSYMKGFESIFYYFIAMPAGIAAICKLVIGFKKFKNTCNTPNESNAIDLSDLYLHFLDKF